MGKHVNNLQTVHKSYLDQYHIPILFLSFPEIIFMSMYYAYKKK